MKTNASRIATMLMLLALALASAGCQEVLAMEAGHDIASLREAL